MYTRIIRWGVVLGVASAVTSAGCSALGLSSFPIGTCVESADCLPANNHNRIAPSSCERFVCVIARDAMGRPIGGHSTGTCVRGIRDDDADGAPNALCVDDPARSDCDDTDPAVRVGHAEVCDGADNDCDGVVDDSVSPFDRGQVVSPTPGTLAVSRQGGLAMVTGGAAPTLVRLDGAAAPQPIPFRAHAVLGPDPSQTGHPGVPLCMPQRSGSLLDSTLADGCPDYNAAAGFSVAPVRLATCSVADAALAASGTGAFVAAVNVLGCAGGQLRVGLLTAPDAPAIELRGPIARSNVFLGVDRQASGCTGSGVAGLTLDSNGDGSRALLAFLDAPATRACGSGDASVRVLGVERIMANTGTTMIPVVDGTGGGVPLTVDQASSLPGVVHVPGGDDWMLAYGTAAGSLVVARASFPTMALTLPRIADESANACIVNTPPPAHALAMPTMVAEIAVGMPIEAVAAAVLDQGHGTDVGVAYQTGCDASAHIGFLIAHADGSHSTPVDLGVGRLPSIAAQQIGIVTPAHHGATAGTTGGFVVGMITADGYTVEHVAGADGAALPETRQTAAHATTGALFQDGSAVGIAWSDPSGVHVVGATCDGSAAP